MDAVVRCVDLKKTWPGKPPVEAVRGITFDVRRGECFGLLGPNGAGKTTTVEILEGLTPRSSGAVEILGMSWGAGRDDEIRQKIGISLQETELTDKLTVLETVRLFRSFYRSGPTPEELLSAVDLTDKSGALVSKLSGGQKQRVALATALAGNPAILFLDEPTTGLDPGSRRAVWEIVGRIIAAGTTVLLTTHYMEEAERLCGRVAIVDRGQLIAIGTPAELIDRIGGDQVVEVALEGRVVDHDLQKDWAGLPGVTAVRLVSGRAQMSVTAPHLTIPSLLDRLGRAGLRLSALTTRTAGLEDVFLALTGRRLGGEESGEGGGR